MLLQIRQPRDQQACGDDRKRIGVEEIGLFEVASHTKKIDAPIRQHQRGDLDDKAPLAAPDRDHERRDDKPFEKNARTRGRLQDKGSPRDHAADRLQQKFDACGTEQRSAGR